MCETKLGCLYKKEKRKTGLLSLHLSWWERRAKQTRETFHLSEGTVHSHIHNSWETETKATVLATGEKWTKMYYRWSQCTFTLTVLSPKQIRGAHLNETAYPKGALKRVSSRFFRTVVSYRAVSYPNLVHSYPVWVRLYQKCFTCDYMNRSPLYDFFLVRQASGVKWVRFQQNSVVCTCDLRKINN